MMQWELELLLNMPVVTGKLVNKASRPFSVTICIHIDGSTQHLFQGVNKTFDKMFLSMQELLCMLKHTYLGTFGCKHIISILILNVTYECILSWRNITPGPNHHLL